MHYYNEINPYCAQWLRNLIDAGHLPQGHVDDRSIVDVEPSDLDGFAQCHFFAGIGGWALAARLAGWPDERELWSGSAPCQPFSVAGKQTGQADERHLWPDLFRLLYARRPAAFVGEQVAAAVGKDWFDGVCFDMESINYACRGAVIPACAVDAPHRRDRLWFVARAMDHGDNTRLERYGRDESETSGRAKPSGSTAATGVCDALAYGALSDDRRRFTEKISRQKSQLGSSVESNDVWHDAEWVVGHDGKARRVGTGVPLLADGIPDYMALVSAFGNAIVPQVAVEVIAALMDCDG